MVYDIVVSVTDPNIVYISNSLNTGGGNVYYLNISVSPPSLHLVADYNAPTGLATTSAYLQQHVPGISIISLYYHLRTHPRDRQSTLKIP